MGSTRADTSRWRRNTPTGSLAWQGVAAGAASRESRSSGFLSLPPTHSLPFSIPLLIVLGSDLAHHFHFLEQIRMPSCTFACIQHETSFLERSTRLPLCLMAPGLNKRRDAHTDAHTHTHTQIQHARSPQVSRWRSTYRTMTPLCEMDDVQTLSLSPLRL
ncbi:hypothetical protein B0T22DRAFT_471256 [Podospora appendiculata]|uniref:Uncharacterized protein n=1 Tax=Podospora appendiculata TaxID=314037 RepID=A0AAE1C847_9PEZI|nr:hypothetical protein B0T22DRAFT_471256 [Podospora appendiculata]